MKFIKKEKEVKYQFVSDYPLQLYTLECSKNKTHCEIFSSIRKLFFIVELINQYGCLCINFKIKSTNSQYTLYLVVCSDF